MRLLVSTIFLVVVVIKLQAQDAYERYTNFFSTELSVGASSSGLAFIPTFSVYRAGHRVDIGTHAKVYDIWDLGPGIPGAYLGYKFHPNLRENTLNLYFTYQTLYTVHQRHRKTPAVVDQLTDQIKYTGLTHLNEHFIGIGSDIQLGNGFFASVDFSAGPLLGWDTYHNSPPEFEIRSTGMIRLGLAYNVGKRKAK